MIPHTPAHERLTRWMPATDPVLATRLETVQAAHIEYEVGEAGNLRMLYAHAEDGSCCEEITNRNQPYVRNAQGGLIRGGE